MRAKTLITAEELLAIPGDPRCELVEGEIREYVPSAGPHGYVTMNFASPLDRFVRERRLGVVNIGELGYLLARNPDTVRVPDVSFVSRECLLGAGLPSTDFWPLAPDLVVEVRSPSESDADVRDKVGDYLRAGVRLVWVAWPPERTITVYAPGRAPVLLREGDVLDGGEVLPGFSVAMREVFERPL